MKRTEQEKLALEAAQAYCAHELLTESNAELRSEIELVNSFFRTH